MSHHGLLDTSLADAGEKLGAVTHAAGHIAKVGCARLQLVERDQADVGGNGRRCRSGGLGFLGGEGLVMRDPDEALNILSSLHTGFPSSGSFVHPNTLSLRKCWHTRAAG